MPWQRNQQQGCWGSAALIAGCLKGGIWRRETCLLGERMGGLLQAAQTSGKKKTTFLKYWGDILFCYPSCKQSSCSCPNGFLLTQGSSLGTPLLLGEEGCPEQLGTNWAGCFAARSEGSAPQYASISASLYFIAAALGVAVAIFSLASDGI